MEVRLKKTRDLIGHTEELKAGTSRTLEAGPLQRDALTAEEGLVEFELGVVMHSTRIHGEMYLGYALFADDMEHARSLPGFKPFAETKQIIVEQRPKRTRATKHRRGGEEEEII